MTDSKIIQVLPRYERTFGSLFHCDSVPKRKENYEVVFKGKWISELWGNKRNFKWMWFAGMPPLELHKIEKPSTESSNSIQWWLLVYSLMDDLYGTLPNEMRVLQTTDSYLITLLTQKG